MTAIILSLLVCLAVPRPAADVIPANALTATGAVGSRGPLSGNLRPRTTALHGVASWYGTGTVAAAGPALRRSLGPGWRGELVRVSSGPRSVIVRLSDWCQCYRGTKGERVIDLGADAFRELAPLAVGVLHVEVSPLSPPPTDTESLR